MANIIYPCFNCANRFRITSMYFCGRVTIITFLYAICYINVFLSNDALYLRWIASYPSYQFTIIPLLMSYFENFNIWKIFITFQISRQKEKNSIRRITPTRKIWIARGMVIVLNLSFFRVFLRQSMFYRPVFNIFDTLVYRWETSANDEVLSRSIFSYCIRKNLKISDKTRSHQEVNTSIYVSPFATNCTFSRSIFDRAPWGWPFTAVYPHTTPRGINVTLFPVRPM